MAQKTFFCPMRRNVGLIGPEGSDIPIVRQCKLPGLPRFTDTCEPAGGNHENLDRPGRSGLGNGLPEAQAGQSRRSKPIFPLPSAKECQFTSQAFTKRLLEVGDPDLH